MDGTDIPVGVAQFNAFAFQTTTWRELRLVTVRLQTVFRQSERAFVTALNKMRLGALDADSVSVLSQCARELPCVGVEEGAVVSLVKGEGKPKKVSIKPTVLYATNRKVDRDNTVELQRLPGAVHSYRARDSALAAAARAMRILSCTNPSIDTIIGKLRPP